MADFGLIKSFQIDNGELKGLSRQECFVLGYELALVDELLKSTAQISRTVHAANRERIAAACNDAKRPFALTWMEVDPSESWMQLEVPAAQAG